MRTELDREGPRITLTGNEVRLPKAAELVSNAIRRQIVTGSLRQGDLLPREGELMTQFDVSRPTLREALRVLESEGFINMRRGANGGARVQLPSDDVAGRYFGALLQSKQTSLLDAFAARTIIEAPVAGLAALNLTSQGLDALQAQIRQAEASFDDPFELWEVCNEFHRVLVNVAGNSTLRLMSGLLDSILERASCAFTVAELELDKPMTASDQPAIRQAHRTHVRLLELVASRDAVAAEALWRKHLSESAHAVIHAPGAKTVLDLMSAPA